MRLLPLVGLTENDPVLYIDPEKIVCVGDLIISEGTRAARAITGIWFAPGSDKPWLQSHEPLEKFLVRLTQFEDEYGTVAASEPEREAIDRFWELYQQEVSPVSTLVRLPKGDWKLCGKVLSISIDPSDIPTAYSHSGNNVFYSDNRYHI